VENHMLHGARKLHGCMFYRTGVIANQNLTLWELEFLTVAVSKMVSVSVLLLLGQYGTHIHEQ